MAKLQLNALEISMVTATVSDSHKSVVAKVKDYNTQLITKATDYAHILYDPQHPQPPTAYDNGAFEKKSLRRSLGIHT